MRVVKIGGGLLLVAGLVAVAFFLWKRHRRSLYERTVQVVPGV